MATDPGDARKGEGLAGDIADALKDADKAFKVNRFKGWVLPDALAVAIVAYIDGIVEDLEGQIGASSSEGGGGASMAFVSTDDPTKDDDSSAEFEPGNVWVNSTAQSVFVNVSAAVGAADWQWVSFSGAFRDSQVGALLSAINPAAHPGGQLLATLAGGGAALINGQAIVVTVTPAPTNYTPGGSVEDHLKGIDAALGTLGGGPHAGTHILGAGDEVDGDQLGISWDPSNSTPSTSPTEVTDDNHLTAHLAGIDTALGTAQAHASSTDNPHGVTVGQTGGDTAGTARPPTAHTHDPPSGSVLATFVLVATQDTITSATFSSVGCCTFDPSDFGTPASLKIRADGFVDTSDALAEIRVVAVNSGTGGTSTFSLFPDTSSSFAAATHDASSITLESLPTLFSIEVRKGGGNFDITGFVLSLIVS